MSLFAAVVSITPLSGMVRAAQADFIYVSAGGPYYNYPAGYGGNDTYNIVATQSQAGIGPYIGTAPAVTIYNRTMVKVVDAQPMTLIDAALGLYNFSGSCGGLEGSNTVIVSGTNSTSSAITATGTATFHVATLDLKIDVIEPPFVNVQVCADSYYYFNSMIATQLTQDGKAYVMDPADELRITIWESGFVSKVVDNVTMTVQDASAGLYTYAFNPGYSGLWTCVVNLTTSSGYIYTGMDQLMIPAQPHGPYGFLVQATWDTELMVTAQFTEAGNTASVDPMWDEARVTIWELETGALEVNDQFMNVYSSVLGLYNYTANGLSKGTSYLIFAEYTSGAAGDLASGSTVINQEQEVIIAIPSPPLNVDVEAGYIHDPWTTGLGITATVTTDGQQRPDDGLSVRVSIYHSDDNNGAFTKVLDNQSMSVLDGPKGVYRYIWGLAGFNSGFYHIVVEADEFGSYYVGVTSTDISDWVGVIYVLDMKSDIIEWELDNYISDFNNTWFQWYNFFNNYSTDLNATLVNLNDTIADISFVVDFSGIENHIVALLNNISGNISMVDQNVSSMNLQVNANAIQLAIVLAELADLDANQAVINQTLNECCALFQDYRNEWNVTIAQIINDLDFQNLTLLSIQSGVSDLHTDLEAFWNDFNDTMASTVNDWFNITWSQIQMFENNITTMINSQDMNITLMENNIVTILNNQDFRIELIDQNITNIDTAMQAGFLNLYAEHATMRDHISNYWAEWNVTIDNIQADIDWLNSTLVVMLDDIVEVNTQLLAFWGDFNTTWNDYNIGFAAYWQLLNLTIDGVNLTLQADIAALSIQMINFENNMNAMLNSVSGNIAAIDQNVSEMRTAMDSHFVQLWNEHNETRDLVGFYWAEWNATLAALVADLDYVNMTTIATNGALALFRTNFRIFWDDYNGTEAVHSTEVEDWFADTWSQMSDFEMDVEDMLDDQNDNLTDIDDQLSTGFSNLYRENGITRSHILVYWNAWNTTRDNVQADLDFIDSELAGLESAGEARDSKLSIHTIFLIICIISAVFMMVVFRKYIAYSFKKKK